jgi:hypothetical protein
LGEKGYEELIIDCTVTEKNNLIRESIADITGKREQCNELNYKVVISCKDYQAKYNNLMQIKYKK